MANGHTVVPDTERLKVPPQRGPSESELSDLNDLPTTIMASPRDPNDTLASDDDAIHDMATSELDEDEDAPGEMDADFDEETPPAEDIDAMEEDQASEDSSSRPGKRKADVDDEEYMKQNPELYGLRRSVRTAFLVRLRRVLTNS